MSAAFQDDLIIDVGMHRGEDAEFYIQKGFRVVGIEADPDLVAIARRNLAPYLGQQLEVCHVAIGSHNGHIDFVTSTHEGWGSALPHAASVQQNLTVSTKTVTVPCTTFETILRKYGVPYYLKVDIEGSDSLCLDALRTCNARPKYVSFECDLGNREAMFGVFATLWSLGYREFKVLNQVLNPTLRCPNPPREGRFVDARFTLMMSGPFGEETPGEWLSCDMAWDRYVAVAKSQALRTNYAATGRVFGLPVGRFHRQLKWLYNFPPIRGARHVYSQLRGVEVGGWFDLHARHASTVRA